MIGCNPLRSIHWAHFSAGPTHFSAAWGGLGTVARRWARRGAALPEGHPAPAHMARPPSPCRPMDAARGPRARARTLVGRPEVGRPAVVAVWGKVCVWAKKTGRSTRGSLKECATPSTLHALCCMLHAAWYMLHAACCMSHVSRRMFHVACGMSHVACRMPHVAFRMPHVACHMLPWPSKLHFQHWRRATQDVYALHVQFRVQGSGSRV